MLQIIPVGKHQCSDYSLPFSFGPRTGMCIQYIQQQLKIRCIFSFFTQRMQGKIHKCGFFSLRESKGKFANVCCITKLIWWKACCLILSFWVPNLPSYEQMSEHILPCLISCSPGMDSWNLHAAEYTLCYQKNWAPASLNTSGRPCFSLKFQFQSPWLSLCT